MRNKHILTLAMLFLSMAVFGQKKTILTDIIKSTTEIWLGNKKVTSIMTDTAFIGATNNQVPSALAVKTYVMNHSGGGGGGGGDDWGAQVVEHGSGLTGNGTAGDPLDWSGASVAGPLTGSGTSLSPLNLLNNSINATHIATGAVDLASGDVTGINPVTKGGSGAGTLTGYVKGNGTSAMTAATLIPESDLSNDGTLARVGDAELIVGNWTFVGTNTKFRDNAFTLSDDGDNTKLAQFQTSGISNATTRTYTLQNKSHTIAGTDDAAGGDASGTLGALTVAKIQGKSIPAPVAGDDLKIIQYNHTSGQFQYVAGGGGGDNWGSQVVQVSSDFTGNGTAGSPLTAGSTLVNTTGSQTLTNKTLTSPVINTPTLTVNDNAFTVQDQTDNTKKAVFEASGIAAATTRTYTLQNKNHTIAATDDAAGGDLTGTLSNLQLASGSVGGAELAVGSVDLASTDVTGVSPVAKGGTGAGTLTGYVKGNGTSAMTASATIPETDIANGTLLARVADNETISGDWLFTGIGNRFNANAFTVRDQTDNTKLGVFNASLISPSTTRTYTFQNKSHTIAATDDAAGGDATGTLSNLNVAKIQGKSIPVPGAPDDGKVVQWNNTTGAFVYATSSGADNWGSQVVQVSSDFTGNGTAGSPLTAGSTLVNTTGSQTLTNKTLTSPVINTPTLTVNDNAFTVQDQSDNTKKMVLEVSGIATATTRTLTIQNKNHTVAATDDAAGGDLTGTLSNLQLASGSVGGAELAVGSVDLASTDVTGVSPVAKGGTGAGTLTGYVKGNGTSAMTAAATIPEADIANGTLLARVADNETISGDWLFTGTGNRFRANAFTLSDQTDNTKLAVFNISGITSGVTRTYTLQNKSSILAAVDDASGGDVSGPLSSITVNKIRNKNIPAPLVGDDLKYVQYNHTTGEFQYATPSGGGGGALSGLTAATAANTIDNLNFAQVWNWSTLSTQTALAASLNAMTTGTALDLTTNNTGLNSTKGLLSVTNTGATASGRLATFQANSTAGSGMYLKTSGNIGIGTDSPGSPLSVSNGNTIGSALANALVYACGVSSTPAIYQIDAFSTGAAGSGFYGRHARGSSTSPAAVNSGDYLAEFSGGGYHSGSAFSNATAIVRMRANQNYTGSAQGSNMGFYVTADGATTPTERFTINADGTLTSGTYATTGALYFNDSGVLTNSKVTISVPATAATLTLANNSTLATSGANNITLTSTGATNVTLPTSGTLVSTNATQTLTNKSITKRVNSNASSGSPAPNSANDDVYALTALAANATFADPGAGTDGQPLLIRIKDNGTSRTLTFNAAYSFSAEIPAPAATVISATLYLTFVYNTNTSKWECIGKTGGF